MIIEFADPTSFPQNLTVTVLSPTEFQVKWENVPDIDQNGIIIDYEVLYISTFDFINGSIFLTNGETSSVNITRLEEFVYYNVSIRAYTDIGPGPFSNVVTNRTREAGWHQFLINVLINLCCKDQIYSVS